MRQTAVYLQDHQLSGLKDASRKLGRSEADLLREGVDLVLARYREPIGECDLPAVHGGGQLASRVDDLLDEGFGRTA
ncbi:ribbon-helix-helix domain-containing protein [Prauserella muralis]|nr:ribbon-helix-helix domain-containing protein [Prauserella muralis]